MTDIRIASLMPAQIAQAASVEQSCLETAWSEAQLRSLPPETIYLVAESGDGRVCGICSARLLDTESELLNLAVLPADRRRHIAAALLKTLFARAVAEGCERMYLEVAQTNDPAIALYRSAGFSIAGVRRGFYHGEDAWIMEKPLC